MRNKKCGNYIAKGFFFKTIIAKEGKFRRNYGAELSLRKKEISEGFMLRRDCCGKLKSS